jgi:hypothetical protein
MPLTRLSGWRRDLLVGLVACALTVTVLIPVGGVLLRRKQQQTAAAADAAAQAVQRAEKSEAEAARYKVQAEHNFQMARRAVDEYFTAVASEQMATPGQLRKQLLEQAEQFHKRQK